MPRVEVQKAMKRTLVVNLGHHKETQNLIHLSYARQALPRETFKAILRDRKSVV